MVTPDRSNEELCVLAKQGEEEAYLQLLEQNRPYIVEQMRKIGFRYHPYWQEMIEWGEIGILSALQDYAPSQGTKFLTFATHRIQNELRGFLHSIRGAYLENYYPDDENEEGDWTGEGVCLRYDPEPHPLEKTILKKRRDLLLDASMEALPELERKYIEYRYGFTIGKLMSRSAVAKILGIPEAKAKRTEEDALEYFRGCFHVDRVNDFYELRPEAETRKELAKNSQEALFDNFSENRVDTLLAQFEEDE